MSAITNLTRIINTLKVAANIIETESDELPNGELKSDLTSCLFIIESQIDDLQQWQNKLNEAAQNQYPNHPSK